MGDDEFIKWIWRAFRKEEKTKLQNRTASDNHGKSIHRDILTPRILQILAITTFIVNLCFILALGFKLVQFYSIIIGFFSIFQIFISSYFYKTPAGDEEYYPYVTVIIPAYNEILNYIHARNIPVITFQQLLALQEESLSDLPLNSFNNNGIRGEEGTYYPRGSIKLVENNGVLLQDYLTDEDIQPLNLPFLASYPMLDNALQTYAKAQITPDDVSANIIIIPLTAAAATLALAKKY